MQATTILGRFVQAKEKRRRNHAQEGGGEWTRRDTHKGGKIQNIAATEQGRGYQQRRACRQKKRCNSSLTWENFTLDCCRVFRSFCWLSLISPCLQRKKHGKKKTRKHHHQQRKSVKGSDTGENKRHTTCLNPYWYMF